MICMAVSIDLFNFIFFWFYFISAESASLGPIFSCCCGVLFSSGWGMDGMEELRSDYTFMVGIAVTCMYFVHTAASLLYPSCSSMAPYR